MIRSRFLAVCEVSKFRIIQLNVNCFFSHHVASYYWMKKALISVKHIIMNLNVPVCCTGAG